MCACARVLSWKWWQASLYGNVSWPAGVYSPDTLECSKSEYNIACLLHANLLAAPCSSPTCSSHERRSKTRTGKKKKKQKHHDVCARRRVMLAGRWPPGDRSYEGLYEAVPFGLLHEVFALPTPPTASPSTASATHHSAQSLAVHEADRKARQERRWGMEHGRWRWGMDGHDFGAWAAASVAALPPSHHQHKHKLVWLRQAALESKSNTSNTSPALPQLQAQLDRRLDNWDIAAIDMEVAALTATSKLLIAALRDDFHVSPPHPPNAHTQTHRHTRTDTR